MILKNERTGQEFTVPPEGVRLGRDPTLEITFSEDNDVVSGTHCRVVRHDDESWWLEDLGSTNGTWLNGQRLGEPARLFTGMKFSLGQRGPVMKVSIPGQVARTQAEPAINLGLPQVRLRRVKGGDDLHAAGMEVVMGRSTSCNLSLRTVADTVVSKRHASITFDEFGNAFLADLGSRNGTYLNGNPVQGRMRLRTGDRIMLGWQGPMFEVRQLGTESLGENEGAPYKPDRQPRSSFEGMVAQSGQEAKAGGRNVVQRTGVFVKSMARQVVHDSSPGFRIAIVVLFLALVTTIVLVYLSSAQRIAEAEARRAEAERAISEQLRQNSALQQRADSEVANLRRQLDDARRSAVSPGVVQALERRLHEQESLATARATQPPAAGAPVPSVDGDFRAVVRDNMRSIGMVISRYANDSVMGTGFAITSSGYFLTNRHVIRPDDRSSAPLQVVVVMAETNVALPVDVVAVSSVPSQDVAILRLRGFTGTPVRQIDWQGRDIQQGAQAALIGFPFGRAFAVDRVGALHPTIFGGLIAATGELIRFSASTYVGASGSPLFNQQGEVIAIHYGAPVAGAGLGFALPMSSVRRWLPQDARAELGL